MNAETLKPCPFCGGENIDLYKEPDIDVGGDFYSRKCRTCGARTAENYARETCPIFFQGLRDAWNTRADTDALTAAQEENERLREALVSIWETGRDHTINMNASSVRIDALARAALNETLDTAAVLPG